MQAREQEFFHLCGSLFTKVELRVFIASVSSRALERLEHTISWDAPFNQICCEISVALGNRRLIDERLFRELLLIRPAASFEIRESARRIGIDSLELVMSDQENALRAEYRSRSWKQFFHGIAWVVFVSSWGRSTNMRSIVLMPLSAVGLTVNLKAVGLSLPVSFALGSALVLLFLFMLYRSIWRMAMRMWEQSGIRGSDVEILVCARDGLELRSPSRASLTPYSLVKLTRMRSGWHIELGAASFEYFPHLNAIGNPEATRVFWDELQRRQNTDHLWRPATGGDLPTANQ